MTIYYEDESVVLHQGSCLNLTEWADADALVSDVPYGIDYYSNQYSQTIARSIAGDEDSSVRDAALDIWRNHPSNNGYDHPNGKPALIFGTWKVLYPHDTRQMLIWDTKGALGMGDLSIPWKPSHQQIYVIGKGFKGKRTSDVLTVAPVQSLGYNGRTHPHEKPVELLMHLIDKCPPGVIADPFAGSGSTLVAAKRLGRKAIGVELEERYCEVIAKRLSQGVLDFGDAS